jgi:heme/copper-type cytochrome/quinol oxidase subunit 2
MKKKNLYKILPFALLGLYFYLKGLFTLDFNYSLIILSVMIVISIWAFLKSQKNKEPEEKKNKIITLTVYSILTLFIFLYSVFFV